MPEFETLSREVLEFKNGGEFLELTVGVVRDAGRENKYLRLARGYYTQEGEPRYKKNSGVTLPADAEVLKQLGAMLAGFDVTKVTAASPPKAEAPVTSDKE